MNHAATTRGLQTHAADYIRQLADLAHDAATEIAQAEGMDAGDVQRFFYIGSQIHAYLVHICGVALKESHQEPEPPPAESIE